MFGHSTIIIVCRLRLIRNVDYIVVLEEGWLVEMVTHDELLPMDGLVPHAYVYLLSLLHFNKLLCDGR